MTATVEIGGVYRLADSDPIALRVIGYAQVWEPDYTIAYDETYDETYEVETGEGEWVDNPERVVVVAVGDDRKDEYGVDELVPLAEGAWCAECGQLGCTADGRG